jgi:hypothetical protein
MRFNVLVALLGATSALRIDSQKAVSPATAGNPDNINPDTGASYNTAG